MACLLPAIVFLPPLPYISTAAGGGANFFNTHHSIQVCSHDAVHDIECYCVGVATGKTHPPTCHGTRSFHIKCGSGPNHDWATYRQAALNAF